MRVCGIQGKCSGYKEIVPIGLDVGGSLCFNASVTRKGKRDGRPARSHELPKAIRGRPPAPADVIGNKDGFTSQGVVASLWG